MKLEHFGMAEPGDCRLVFTASAEELTAALAKEQAAPDAPQEDAPAASDSPFPRPCRAGAWRLSMPSPMIGRWLGVSRDGEVAANLRQPLSLLRRQRPYHLCPFGTFSPPDRGNRPLQGEPLDDVIHISFWSSL